MIVELSERAEAELLSAAAFLREDSPRAAEKVHAAIERALDSLGDLPNRGRAGSVEATRELPVRGAPYVIVYSVRAELVFVTRIRHTSQDPSPE